MRTSFLLYGLTIWLLAACSSEPQPTVVSQALELGPGGAKVGTLLRTLANPRACVPQLGVVVGVPSVMGALQSTGGRSPL